MDAPVERKKVWACGACGKVAPTRNEFKDTSCMTWGVEVWEDTIVYRSETDRRITKAVAVDAEP